MRPECLPRLEDIHAVQRAGRAGNAGEGECHSRLTAGGAGAATVPDYLIAFSIALGNRS